MRLWSSQDLTNASTTVHFSALFTPASLPHVYPHVLPDTHPSPQTRYLCPTLQNTASLHDNRATVWMKSRRTARLFEMSFTSAPPHVLPDWPPVYLTGWLAWGCLCACMCVHVHVCMCVCVCVCVGEWERERGEWVAVYFASGKSISAWTAAITEFHNLAGLLHIFFK